MAQWARRGRRRRRVPLWGWTGWLDAVAAEDGAQVLASPGSAPALPGEASAGQGQAAALANSDDQVVGAVAP